MTTYLETSAAARRLGCSRTALRSYDRVLRPVLRGRRSPKLYDVAAVDALAATRAAKIGATEAAELLGLRVDQLPRLDDELRPERDSRDHRVYARAAVEFLAGERAARAAAAATATEAL